MATAIVTIVGAVITAVLIPLFGQWLKSWLSQIASDAAAKQLAIALQNQAAANSSDQQKTATQINEQIAAETKAKEAFVQSQK